MADGERDRLRCRDAVGEHFDISICHVPFQTIVFSSRVYLLSGVRLAFCDVEGLCRIGLWFFDAFLLVPLAFFVVL